jgi:hypothetical protein
MISPLRQKRQVRFLLWALMMAVGGISAMAEDDYFPLQVGQVRIMTTVYVSAEGKVVGSDHSQNITSTVVTDGKTYFRCVSGNKGPQRPLLPPILYRKDEKAVYSLEEAAGGAVERIELVLPLRVGATWQRVVGRVTRTVTVMGVETVEIDEKTYLNCYHLCETSEDGSYTQDAWIAPGVGTVKANTVYDNGMRMNLTLKEFKPGTEMLTH